MANHASAAKRNRQRLVRTERNRAAKNTVRSAVKRARAALGAGDKAGAADQVKAAAVALAKGVAKGVVHKKAAARVTSRIQSALAKLG
jgi:small subunit ribosomal protein S20